MSKVALISDIHFGSGTHLGTVDAVSGHNTRFIDFINTFNSIIDYLIESEITHLIIAGDIYKNRQPTPTQQLAFTQALNKLSKNSIYTYITLGNHDMVMGSGKAHTVSIFEELQLPYINVISEPTLLSNEDGLPCNIMAFPYMNRQTCGVDTNDQIIESVRLQVEAWKEEIDNEFTTMIVGHNIIEGTCVADIQPDVNILNEPTFTVEFFTSLEIDAAFFGHVHEHIIVNEEPLVVSLGSMERIDFNDATRDKFLTVFDVETKELFKEELSSREFLNYKANLVGVAGDLTDLVCGRLRELDVTNKIVRVLIKIEKDRAPLIIKDRILAVLDEAHFSAGIGFKYVESEEEEGDVLTDDLQPSMCVEDYLNRMILQDEHKERIKETSLAIMQEVDNDIEVVNT